jgi:hypothetical protein
MPVPSLAAPWGCLGARRAWRWALGGIRSSSLRSILRGRQLPQRLLAAAERDRIRRQPARRAQWIVWDESNQEWNVDSINVAQRLAREVCREEAEACDEPALDSARVVSAVLSLAKCDPRLACADWPPHRDLTAAVSGWLADCCVIDAEAWTRRSDILASAAPYGWDRFEGEDLTAALAARGIV